MFQSKKFTLVGCTLVSKNGWGMLKGSLEVETPMGTLNKRLSIELIPSFGCDFGDRQAARALREKLSSNPFNKGSKLEVTCGLVLKDETYEGSDKKEYTDTMVGFYVADFEILEQGSGEQVVFSAYVKKDGKQESTAPTASGKGPMPTDEAIAR